MANSKMTKVQMFSLIMDKVSDNQEMVDFIAHEIELIEKKSATKSAAKVQKAEDNAKLAEIVLDALANCDGAVTITELMKSDERLFGFSNQKVSYLMRTLVADGKVVKNTDKKTSLFSIA